jgi:hypothetical protein
MAVGVGVWVGVVCSAGARDVIGSGSRGVAGVWVVRGEEGSHNSSFRPRLRVCLAIGDMVVADDMVVLVQPRRPDIVNPFAVAAERPVEARGGRAQWQEERHAFIVMWLDECTLHKATQRAKERREMALVILVGIVIGLMITVHDLRGTMVRMCERSESMGRECACAHSLRECALAERRGAYLSCPRVGPNSTRVAGVARGEGGVPDPKR